jgi:hypothetical protein
MTTTGILSKNFLRGLRPANIEAKNVSPWCRIPASAFSPGFVLYPNYPKGEPAFVTFGPIELPEHIDTLGFFFSSVIGVEHPNAINADVTISDNARRCVAQSRLCLSFADRKPLTLQINGREGGKIYITISASFQCFVDPEKYGGISLDSIVGYQRNPLVELFNDVGSDKGTVWCFGGGAPHCYALEYYRLFEAFRDEEFNFLEIGLDNASKTVGSPKDAPSLRAWLSFFAKANLYGCDLHDFSFLRQKRVFTFQGDQSSRDDWTRLINTYTGVQFRVILDDGSHASSHQQISLAALFPHVEPNGMYLVEDLGWQPFPESAKTLDVLQKFSDTGRLDSPFLSELEAHYLEKTISRVEIYKPNDSEFAVIYKRE